MLTLTISDHRSPPPLPCLSDPRVSLWRDTEGAVCAYGEIVDGAYWLHLPALASFTFSPHSAGVVAVPQPGARLELVRDAFTRSVLPMAMQALGDEALHASAILLSGGVVALCAASETGKSTLAYALGRRGHPVWADDAVVFKPDAGTVAAVPVPFAVRLRPASAAYFKARSDTVDMPPVAADANHPVPMAAVCVLRRVQDAGRSVAITRLHPVAAFTAVLEHAYCFALHDAERKRRLIGAYLALTTHVPVFLIELPDDLAQVPTVAEMIERAVLRSTPAVSMRAEAGLTVPRP